jgi:hypothetical protein
MAHVNTLKISSYQDYVTLREKLKVYKMCRHVHKSSLLFTQPSQDLHTVARFVVMNPFLVYLMLQYKSR